MKLLEVIQNPGEIVVFHGSTHEIKKFVDDFVGGKDATDQEGPGIYFTTEESDAERYGEFLYKAILKPRKLLTTKPRGGSIPELMKLAKMAPNWEETVLNWDENPAKGIVEAIKAAYQYNDNEKDRFLQIWIEFYRDNPLAYVRNCVNMGYDGIIVDRPTGKHIIVYNPNIIFIEQ